MSFKDTKYKAFDMKKSLLLSLAVLFLVTVFSVDSFAQKKKKRQSEVDTYFDESGSIKHRLWFGGGANINFSGNGQVQAFNLGISPMVGYKILPNNDNFSVGPRVALQYTYLKLVSGGQSYVSQPLSYSFGAFARYRIIPIIFAHAEFEYENEAYATGNIGNNNNLIVEREAKNNAFLGLGYNSGGLIAYEAYILYNLLEDRSSNNLPFDIRFGFTYKF